MKKIFTKIKKFLLQLIIGKEYYNDLLVILNSEALDYYNDLREINNILIFNATKILLKRNIAIIHSLGGYVYDELQKFDKEGEIII